MKAKKRTALYDCGRTALSGASLFSDYEGGCGAVCQILDTGRCGLSECIR